MKKHATVLRTTTHAEESFAPGNVILGMDAGQFTDWEGAGLVREATDAEVARAKGTPATPATPKSTRKRKSAPKPAAAPSSPPAPDAAPATPDA